MPKPWRLSRRTFLHGAASGVGVSLGLPALECMAADSGRTAPPKRFCAVYFPYGVVLRSPESQASEWNWFPSGEGADFRFGKSHQALEPLRSKLTVLSGLSHPRCRQMGGHDTADTWLTGVEMREGHLENAVSVDQAMAMRIGRQTRYSSLVLSTDGGVGEPTRASTLSFNRDGAPLPSQNKPRRVFDRLFGVNPDSTAAQRRELANSGSMLDLVLDHSKSLSGRLGEHDKKKLDEYLTSVRRIEQRVERSEQWLEVPKPQVDASGLSLEADDTTPRELIRTMYDLIYLAFQTDQTRIATYQLGNMNGATSIAGKFPQLLGMAENMHALAHGARKGDDGAKPLGEWDAFLTRQLAYFLNRLASTAEGEGTLLDNTAILYGTSNSQTHVNENYALMLAGGSSMGFRHGRHLAYSADIPMSNLLAMLLQRVAGGDETFADSDGPLPAIAG